MPDIYVRSTDGSDADNGSTWALAKATLAGADAIDAAGDTIYVSDNHSENTAGAVTLSLAGTLTAPTRLICVDDAAQPPTASLATALAECTSWGINGNAYIDGFTFIANAGSIVQASAAGARQVYRNCKFRILTNTQTYRIRAGNPAAIVDSYVKWENCDVRFGFTSNRILVAVARFVWNGGVYESGGTQVPVLVECGNMGRTGSAFLSGLDLTNASSSMHIFDGTYGNGKFEIRNSRLPANWTGSLATGTLAPGFRAEMYNCDSGDTNYTMVVQDYIGIVSHEATIVRAGGAVDGTTRLAWKVVSNANANYPLTTLDTPEIVRWNDTVGTPITVTVEVLTDNVTLTNEQCWLEVQFLGTSGFPISSFVSDAKVDVLATAANQDTSTATWVTTGITTPVRQKLSVTFTPQEKGFIHAVVKLARPSTTVYVDPKITVS